MRVERSSHPSLEDRRDCPGSVFDEAVAVAAMRMSAAYETEAMWAVRVAKGYVARHLPPASRMWLVDFAADGEAYETFSKTIDLFGDGTIRLISTPGHTVGHLSVLLRLDCGHHILVGGDAAYTLRGIQEKILPLLTADDEASIRSLTEIAAFAERRPQTMLVPSHDPDACIASR
jgi:glyoxylase-like metal-dependent hydrolase (beta-lactamase superfamily II)